MGETCENRGWWTKFSESRLVQLEQHILSVVRSKFRTWFVPIGPTVGQDDKIWTILLNEDAKKTPLVMLHGFAAALGFWCKNFDEIAQDRPVYAIDLLGFGRSSRPNFAKNHETSEQQWVNALEEWRKEVKLDKFILLGHSFGGYLATSYAINHPDRVKHLILADPWGFGEKPNDLKPKMWIRVLLVVLYPLTCLNPLATVRAAGPFGPALIKKLRGDIAARYEDSFEDTNVITDYIYQCNSQHPSGESAFHSYLNGFAWSKSPLINRSDKIDKNLPITVLYGEHSWVDKKPGSLLQEMRQSTSYVNVDIIPSSGHHLYSDQPEIFNKYVVETCRIADENRDTKEMMSETVKLLKEKFDHDKIKGLIHEKNAQKSYAERNAFKVSDDKEEENGKNLREKDS
ncbi:(Lyso)-N-acylphosphatidylethanolamine lipase-like [Anthonomus grandis grandis]|uniref:(Lyso)-N-acylphosphatidylethanolamine lipase-like n=1 Tax=Anthonomus grandis grandis TaxID=2921223 RepID=UPI0021667ECA|nr:(Lyso)-N-acylphosphatidylethanolamine lipase-like [Anthonomus grandis grandis]